MISTYNSLSLDTKVAVNNASVKVIPANGRRVYAMIRNVSGVNMWLGKGQAAVIGNGHLLRPGEWYEINVNSNPFVGHLYAIMETAGAVNQPVEEAIN